MGVVYGSRKRKILCREGKKTYEGEPLLAEKALRDLRNHRGCVQPLHDKRTPAKNGCACKHCEHTSHNNRLSDWERLQLRLRPAEDTACLEQG